MRRRANERRERRLLQLARWIETLWWCKCDYNNVAAYRCFHCGARPPRRLRAQMAAITVPKKELAATDA
jgi:hypothetical protein